MPIKAATYWVVICDHPDCAKGLWEVTGEFSAMADEDQAREAWENADGAVLPDGQTLCWIHRPTCEECGLSLDSDNRCEDCADSSSQSNPTPKEQ